MSNVIAKGISSTLKTAEKEAIRANIGLGTAAIADIVGTVSQSGAVPTGSIIERGSNANGEYVKFADGTMICFGRRTTAPTTSSSNVFGSTSGTTYYESMVVTYPSMFITSPFVVCNSDIQAAGSTAKAQSPSGLSSFTMVATTTSNTHAGTASFIAIGRWY